jgi:hypothetical protein
MSLEWINLNDNQGKKGPDDGKVLIDTELAGLARLVSEEKNDPRGTGYIYAVTTVIYDRFIGTSYFSNSEDASEHLDATKNLIRCLLDSNRQ